MKLHLPSALRRSLLSCLAFVSSIFSPSVATGSLLAAGGLVLFSLAPQVQAGAVVKTEKTTVIDDITYSGLVISLESTPDVNNNVNISAATFTWDGNSYLGTDKVNENGPGSNDELWRNLFCGTSNGSNDTGTYGHTLRLASSIGGPTRFTFDFDYVMLGGLIVEANTNSATRWYTIYVNGKETRGLFWWSNGDTILNIKGNMAISNSDTEKYTASVFRDTARWIVDSSHTLNWLGIKNTLNGDLTLEGGGLVQNISNGLEEAKFITVSSGKTVTVLEGTRLAFRATDGGATEGGFLLENNATVNITSGTITLAELTGPTSGAGRISGTSGWQFADSAKITGNISAAADTTLSLGSTLTFSNAKLAATGDSVFTLSNATGTLSLQGDVTFNGGVIKTDGVVSSDGTLTVAQGTWESTNSLDLHSGSVRVENGATLKVSGKLNFGGASLWFGGTSDLVFVDSVTISGEGELDTGRISTTGTGTITIADGASLTLSTDGSKNFGGNINLAGENSRLIIKRLTGFTGTGGLVTGQGVLVYDFDNLESGLGGCIDVDGYSGAPYTLGGDAGRFISTTAGEMLKELRLAEGTVLSVSYTMSGNMGSRDASQETKFNNISRLVVEDGAAIALRAWKDTIFGSSANTLVLSGEAEIQSESGQAAKNGGVYQGSLLVGADAMLTGDALNYNLNSNIELLSDTGVFVALSSRDNEKNKYTLTLGSAADSGSLKANGHVLTKRGGGIIELGQYFKTAAGDTGVFDVQEGTLSLAYADPASYETQDEMWNTVLANYAVRVGDEGRLLLQGREGNVCGYVIQSLGGSGVLELGEHSDPGLIISNQLTTDTANNTFTGTIKVTSSQTLNLTLDSGYQRLAAAIEREADSGTEADFALAVQVNGGVLDLTGFDDKREAGAAISVTLGDEAANASAQVLGLVLHMGDVLDLNSQAVNFNVTMKGGSLLNSGNYTGVITVDDSEIVDEGSYAVFDLGALHVQARVTVHALSAGATDGSYVSVQQRLTLTGNSTVSLGDYVQEGQGGFERGMFYISTGTGTLTMANGATLTVNIANILDSITAAADGVSYRLSNHSIDSIFDQLSFGAELAIFNVKVEKGETTGSLRFSMLKADWDHVYQATDNNDGSDWHAGNDIYASTEPYTAVYIDRDTDIDLRGASMGSHEDGLVLKNLTGTETGELTIEGDGKGRSLVTICNNLTDAQLKALSDEMGVEVINTLSYLGNITLTNADLQVKHRETDSTTNMLGRLTLQGDSALMMTSGVLKLSSQGNDLGTGGVSFVGSNSQLHLEGGSARLSGNISLDQPVDDVDPDAVQHEQHIRLTDGAELQLAGSTTVASGITIGHDDAATANGTLSVLGNTAMGAGAVVQNVMLYLAEGSHLSVNSAADVRAIAAQDLEPGAEWAVQGIVGSGKLSSAVQQDMTVTVRNQDCVYSGDLSGYNGSMTLQGGDHAQVFSGVLGGTGWNLTNTNGSSLVLDLVGERALNALQFGSLTLEKGSTTSILMDLADAVSGKGVNMESFKYSAGASVTVGHYLGSVRLDNAAADGSVDLVIGHVDNWEGDLSDWTVTGVRNIKDDSNAEVYVDENGTIHARVVVDDANLWEARTSGENAEAGANLLWGVKDTGAIGGDLAALDSRINSLIGGSNWKTPGNAEEASRILAAAAGASTAVLGQAIASDVDRQMRAIRNRTTSMGYTELDNPQSAELPRWSAWLNAESYYHTQKEDGLMPGYKLNSWGGTVGAHVDTDTDTTLGLALTAMYGDLESQGPDTLKGDLATYYVSGFARMASGAWLHTVVCTVGLAQLDADRTVRYDESAAYTTSGSTQGWSLGLMYEVGYSIAMNEYGTVCLQPVANVAWRYTMLNAYTETGSTAALEVDKQTYSTLTFGMGARMQSTMGDRVFNGAGLLEARALLKLELGDRQGESSVSFARAAGSSATVKGSQRGVAGLELGVGVCLPVSDEGSEIFADVSAEVRSNATELNATLGYRFSF